MFPLKEKLLATCLQLIQNQLSSITASIKEAQDAANEDTKSSAGDKYETTRAMMQIEIENLSKRLATAQQQQQILQQIVFQPHYTLATTGAVVETSQGFYFLAIGLGKLTIDSTDFFVVSPQSPIGAKLYQAKVNDEVLFNGKKMTIKAIW